MCVEVIEDSNLGKQKSIMPMHKHKSIRPMNAELDAADSILFDVNKERHAAKEMAHLLHDENLINHNDKSISFHWTRIREKLLEEEELIRRGGAILWTSDQDMALIDALNTALQLIPHPAESATAQVWSVVASILHKKNSEWVFSTESCRERYETIQNGTAAVGREVDDSDMYFAKHLRIRENYILRQATQGKATTEEKTKDKATQEVRCNTPMKSLATHSRKASKMPHEQSGGIDKRANPHNLTYDLNLKNDMSLHSRLLNDTHGHDDEQNTGRPSESNLYDPTWRQDDGANPPFPDKKTKCIIHQTTRADDMVDPQDGEFLIAIERMNLDGIRCTKRGGTCSELEEHLRRVRLDSPVAYNRVSVAGQDLEGEISTQVKHKQATAQVSGKKARRRRKRHRRKVAALSALEIKGRGGDVKDDPVEDPADTMDYKLESEQESKATPIPRYPLRSRYKMSRAST